MAGCLQFSREARKSGAERPKGRRVGTKVRKVIWGGGGVWRQITEGLADDSEKCIFYSE